MPWGTFWTWLAQAGIVLLLLLAVIVVVAATWYAIRTETGKGGDHRES